MTNHRRPQHQDDEKSDSKQDPTEPADDGSTEGERIPVPPDYDQPTAPVREPDKPFPAGDPKPAEPTRIVGTMSPIAVLTIF